MNGRIRKAIAVGSALRVSAARLVLSAGVVGVGTLSFGASSALATGTLDQWNPGPRTGAQLFAHNNNGNPATYEVGQTFTAGLTGSLDTVKLNIWNATGNTGDLIVKLEGASNLLNPGVPDDGDVLASTTVTAANFAPSNTNSATVLTVAFASPPVIHAGIPYAIVLSSTLGNFVPGPAGFYDEWGTTANNYAGGTFCSGFAGSWTCNTVSGDASSQPT
jgi:hypothetical protein